MQRAVGLDWRSLFQIISEESWAFCGVARKTRLHRVDVGNTMVGCRATRIHVIAG